MPHVLQISPDHISRISGFSRPWTGVMFSSGMGAWDWSARVVAATDFPRPSRRAKSSSSVTVLGSDAGGKIYGFA